MLNGLGENIPVVLTLSKENNKSWIGIEYKVRLPKRGCRRRSEEVRVKSMDYLEKLDRHFREMTGKTALRDMGREISYGELGIISGRIYSYLRAMNIGREDIVLINLPRGAAVVCAMVGVLRSGGAFIVMDAGDPEERIKYVFHESGSRLLLTQAGLDAAARHSGGLRPPPEAAFGSPIQGGPTNTKRPGPLVGPGPFGKGTVL